MRIFLSMLLLASLCLACQPQQKAALQQEEQEPEETTLSIAGHWISEDYYLSIRQLASPSRAQEVARYAWFPDRLQEPVSMIYYFDEALWPANVIVRNEGQYQIWEVQDDGNLLELITTVEVINTERIRIEEVYFVRFDPEISEGNCLILEELLFKGLYTDAKGRSIAFGRNGTLSGLGDYEYCKPEINYKGAYRNLDMLALGNPERGQDWYSFRFKHDTLELCNIRCLQYDADSLCIEETYGTVVYKLWKNKQKQ